MLYIAFCIVCHLIRIGGNQSHFDFIYFWDSNASCMRYNQSIDHSLNLNSNVNANVTRHSRSVTVWISQNADAVCMGYSQKQNLV